jgi:hypothetical protein
MLLATSQREGCHLTQRNEGSKCAHKPSRASVDCCVARPAAASAAVMTRAASALLMAFIGFRAGSMYSPSGISCRDAMATLCGARHCESESNDGELVCKKASILWRTSRKRAPARTTSRARRQQCSDKGPHTTARANRKTTPPPAPSPHTSRHARTGRPPIPSRKKTPAARHVEPHAADEGAEGDQQGHGRDHPPRAERQRGEPVQVDRHPHGRAHAATQPLTRV